MWQRPGAMHPHHKIKHVAVTIVFTSCRAPVPASCAPSLPGSMLGLELFGRVF